MSNENIKLENNKEIKKDDPTKFFSARFLKFVGSKTFIVIFVTAVLILAAFSLYLLDIYNSYKPRWFDNNFIQEIFVKLGIKKFDVTMATWLLLGIIFIVVYNIFFIAYLYKPLKAKKIGLCDKSSEASIQEYKKKSSKFNFLFFFLVILADLIIAGVFFFLFYKYWDVLTKQFQNFKLENFLSLLAATGILILFLFSPLILFFIIYTIIWLIRLIVYKSSKKTKIQEKCNHMFPALSRIDELMLERDREIKEKLKEEEKLAKINRKNEGKNNKNNSDINNSTEKPSVESNKNEQNIENIDLGDIKIDDDKNQLSADEKNTKLTGKIDKTNNKEAEIVDSNNKLRLFPNRFQSYLAVNHKLYFTLPIIRAFVAGLSASRFIMLEGLSGTGKTSLPRVFNNFIGGKANFFPVQATWRDRSDIIGYFSDFTGQYKETEFLKSLYEANYNLDKINLMVLDEMNISRVEYYFADFLSILEYPEEDWVVPLMNATNNEGMPKKLENGKIRIPNNTWFVGTINVDESTFSVSDKVYDRAIIIDFKELSMPESNNYPSDVWNITHKELDEQFKYFVSSPLYQLNDKDREKFRKLCQFAADIFDIKFGNRIMNQIDNFVPVYVALGGTTIEGLDFMFARKILRKIDGKFESYISNGLTRLQKYIRTEYGNKFKETEDHIAKLQKKFS